MSPNGAVPRIRLDNRVVRSLRARDHGLGDLVPVVRNNVILEDPDTGVFVEAKITRRDRYPVPV